MATYNRYSPYYQTKQESWYLGNYEHTTFDVADDDSYMVIPMEYHLQPWRLAKELYGNERLYYVFTLANMNLIQDPLYDFKAGLTIRVPSNERVQYVIGGK